MSHPPRIAPYGAWKSPITSDLIVSATIGLRQVMLDGSDMYWSETRPLDGGRYVIVRHDRAGQTEDVTPAPFNARTRVHEYGGGEYLVADGTVYFSNFTDQRLYRQDRGESPRALTPEGGRRFADAVLDRTRDRLIAVCEDHTVPDREAVTTLVAIPTDGGAPVTLVAGNDFFSSPRLSPDGTKLAWLAWNHPNMPWDGTELWIADVAADGTLSNRRRVAGGARESVFQPEWSPDGGLHFISDRSGWWNLYRFDDPETRALYPMDAEWGEPQWEFRMATYAFADADRIVCTYGSAEGKRIALLQSGRLTPFDLPFTEIWSVRAAADRAVFLAGSPTVPTAVVALDLTTGGWTVLRQSSTATVDPGYLSIPEEVEFPTADGLTAYGYYYAPRNGDFQAPEGERPPLLVKSHGGPTAATSTLFNLKIQYWTSRGFAVLDVNYGGSTGYGRAYRERLRDRWGIVDVDDCTNGANWLAAKGLVDGDRLAIDGGSAGGYTTLAALTFRDTFKAGASHYGVSDLEALVADTHKFEARYLDNLIGPYPERKDLYLARSPIHHTDRLNCPVIFFQGLDDKIVPPNQAEMMVAALRDKGVPVAYVPFAGEQHGFRQAANIRRALDGELYFYSRVFRFEPADPIEPVPIDNLK